jgi:hypothetical protein
MTASGPGQNPPLSVVVEPVPTKNAGVYVALAVSDIFVKTGDEFIRFSEAPRKTPIVNQDGKEPK